MCTFFCERVNPSFPNISRPIRFIVFALTTRISLFVASRSPDRRFICIIPVIGIIICYWSIYTGSGRLLVLSTWLICTLVLFFPLPFYKWSFEGCLCLRASLSRMCLWMFWSRFHLRYLEIVFVGVRGRNFLDVWGLQYSSCRILPGCKTCFQGLMFRLWLPFGYPGVVVLLVVVLVQFWCSWLV